MKLKNMKLTHIALAVASLGMASAHAGSLPGLTGSGIPASNQIFISGASALSASVASVVGTLCSVPVTTQSCGSSGLVVSCTSGNSTSGFSGVPFAVSKRDTDGSFAGVGNVISQTPITGWCDVGSSTPNSTVAIAPNAGLSDVDTNVWIGMSPSGTAALSIPVPAPTGVTRVGGFAGQGFGVMVSESMYRAMQVVQVNDGRLPSGSAPNGCSNHVGPALATTATVAAVDPSFTAGRCQPSISKAEYAAIVDSGNTNYYNSVMLTGTTDPINLCRRVETSGTQAASNVYFLNNSCGNANPTFGFKSPKRVIFPGEGGFGVVISGSGSAANGNYEELGTLGTIFEGSGTGDARNCISNRSTGRNPSNLPATDSDANPNNGLDGYGFYAAGVISLENQPATGRRYVKLDGVSPNAYQVVVGSTADGTGTAADGWAQDTTQRINTVRGYYDFAPEFEMLWSDNTSVNPANFVTAFTQIRNTFANPATVNLNGVFQANGTFSHASNPTRVHKGTRGGNFCTPQALAE